MGEDMNKGQRCDLISLIVGFLLHVGVYIYIALNYGKEVFWLLFLIELARNIRSDATFLKKD